MNALRRVETPYEVLGLSEKASAEEVKKTYRRLAMRLHPDRNPDPQAVAHFQTVQAAYEALSLNNKKQEKTTRKKSKNTKPERENTGHPAADIRLNLEVTLEEGFLGAKKVIDFWRKTRCDTCDGTGEAGVQRSRFCPRCHGTGRLRGKSGGGLEHCDDCAGKGMLSERICPDCAGKTYRSEACRLEVQVPPGLLTGDELRLMGQGEMPLATQGENATGNLYLTIVLQSHPLFRLRGRDLFLSQPVNALSLISGEKIKVASLHGAVDCVLPENAYPGEIRLPKQGYAGRGKIPAGDLFLTLEAVFPRQLSEKQREELRKLNASLAESRTETLPEVESWWNAYSSGNI